jgi:hypothetical protein
MTKLPIDSFKFPYESKEFFSSVPVLNEWSVLQTQFSDNGIRLIGKVKPKTLWEVCWWVTTPAAKSLERKGDFWFLTTEPGILIKGQHGHSATVSVGELTFVLGRINTNVDTEKDFISKNFELVMLKAILDHSEKVVDKVNQDITNGKLIASD